MVTELDSLVRLVMALFLGGVIGYERQSNNKSAGLRTHILVCIGSCLIMILSLNVYYQVQGLTNADPARLAAQVVSGIGFLGAGTIMKEGVTVKGLTTAASLWVVSGVGLAVGSGYYLGAISTTGLVFLTLSLLSRFEKWVCHLSSAKCFLISSRNAPGQIGRICTCLGDAGINIRDIKMEEEIEDGIMITVTVDCIENIDVNTITAALLEVEGVCGVKNE